MRGSQSFLYLVIFDWSSGATSYMTVRDYGNARAIHKAERFIILNHIELPAGQEGQGEIIRKRAFRLYLPDAVSSVCLL